MLFLTLYCINYQGYERSSSNHSIWGHKNTQITSSTVHVLLTSQNFVTNNATRFFWPMTWWSHVGKTITIANFCKTFHNYFFVKPWIITITGHQTIPLSTYAVTWSTNVCLRTSIFAPPDKLIFLYKQLDLNTIHSRVLTGVMKRYSLSVKKAEIKALNPQRWVIRSSYYLANCQSEVPHTCHLPKK